MDALEDSNWLLGDPSWWNLEDKLPPDLRNGELIPPESWIYSSPREGSKGWKRQRLWCAPNKKNYSKSNRGSTIKKNPFWRN